MTMGFPGFEDVGVRRGFVVRPVAGRRQRRIRMSSKSDVEPIVTISTEEAKQVERANESNKRPVAFVHGLWLLPSSWDNWVEVFEEAGMVAVTPGWPDDPETVADAKAHPEVFAGKSI